jgi:hypothetical protein
VHGGTRWTCQRLRNQISNSLVIRDCYALSNNETTKFADWVCCYLTCHEVDGDSHNQRWPPGADGRRDQGCRIRTADGGTPGMITI